MPAKINRDRRDRVKILLTCGHHIRARLEPLNPGTVYPCTQNLGCGYRLVWMSWEDTASGRKKINPRYERDGSEVDRAS